MTSASKSFGRPERYGLAQMKAGDTKSFPDITPEQHGLIKRSAHNYNARTDMYFTTKFKDGVLYVTRLH